MPTDAEVLAILAAAQSRRGLECLNCPDRVVLPHGIGCVKEEICLAELRALREWVAERGGK